MSCHILCSEVHPAYILSTQFYIAAGPNVSIVYICVHTEPLTSIPSSRTYHEATGDIRLEDVIKGAPGEGAAVEGEDLRHVAQAVFIMSTASYCQRGLGVVGLGFVLFRTRRVEYTVQR